MLGRTLPSGSDAISFHNTLFRVSELCWIKAVRLSPPELFARVAALVLAIVWVFAMKTAKGTFHNVEFLLGLLPLVLAWSTSGSLRIGCTGDFEESYEERRGTRGDLFRGWISTLRTKEPNWVHLQGPSYEILLNPQRIAWIRPCFQWALYPLIVAIVFAGYVFLLGLNLQLANMPVLDDFRILMFEGSTGTVRLLSFLVIGVALLAFGLSFKRSVEICGTGGVQDTFPITSADQDRLVDMIAGRMASGGTSAPAAVKGQAQSLEVKVSPASASTPAKTVEVVKPVNIEPAKSNDDTLTP